MAKQAPDVVTVNGYVRQLVEPYWHNEPYLARKAGFAIHHARHPSLIGQLRHTWKATVGDDAGSGIAASKPPMALGAFDVLERVTAASADWLSRRLKLRLRGTVEANVWLLGSRLAEDQEIGEDIERWWRWARVETQWDGRPRDLRDPCPHCNERGLRVAWDVTAAWCRECGEAWGQGELGLLAAQIEYDRQDRETFVELLDRVTP